MKKLLQKARYLPVISHILYGVAKPVYHVASFLQREIPKKIKRSGGVVDYDGVTLKFPVGVGYSIFSSISWWGTNGCEPYTWRELRRLIQNARTFIDVGANVGLYSVLAKKVRPDIEVISFEPVHSIYNACVSLHIANGLLASNVHELALSDVDGEAKIFEPLHDHDIGYSAASTLVVDSWQARKAPRVSVIKTAKLDTFLAGRELKSPLAIKIDVEDFEASVLKGALLTIERYRPWIVCEILPRSHGNRESLEVIRAMRYVPYAITTEGCFKIDFEDFNQQRLFTDFLLIPESDANQSFISAASVPSSI